MKKSIKKYVFILGVFAVVCCLAFVLLSVPIPEKEITISSDNVGGAIGMETFEECVAAGNPVMESYPRQCQSEHGLFTENIGNEMVKIDIIRIDSPRPNQLINSPLVVSGQARGSWFFEGDFPVILTNWDGLIIAEGYAMAQTDWMTGKFVPFTAELTFVIPEYLDRGILILRKDNPSGLSENDDALEIPIRF